MGETANVGWDHYWIPGRTNHVQKNIHYESIIETIRSVRVVNKRKSIWWLSWHYNSYNCIIVAKRHRCSIIYHHKWTRFRLMGKIEMTWAFWERQSNRIALKWKHVFSWPHIHEQTHRNPKIKSQEYWWQIELLLPFPIMFFWKQIQQVVQRFDRSNSLNNKSRTKKNEQQINLTILSHWKIFIL